jgi:hypothetical protein
MNTTNKKMTVTNKTKTKTRTRTKTKTRKMHVLENKTPKNIYDLSVKIQNDIEHNKKIDVIDIISYAPSINKQLVSLKSVKREEMVDCNSEKAYELKEPLKIAVTNEIKCLPFNDKNSIKQQLKLLSANKHVDINKIVSPIQYMSNCWFNTMFMTFFISDKGRKFFHFFRQLMIEGKQSNGTIIPQELHNAFALLNYAIEASLTNSEFAYKMDTNTIIKTIYNAIPESFKKEHPFIADINKVNNPLRYYMSLMDYLGNYPVKLVSFRINSNKWSEDLLKFMKKIENRLNPHIIILEIYDGDNNSAGDSGKITNKVKKFSILGNKYALDSCIIRDTSQRHFCCTLTCENKEYAYDGFSYKRLVKMNWKNKINENYEWMFEGSNNTDGSPLKWNFLKGYQMLFYYRVA